MTTRTETILPFDPALWPQIVGAEVAIRTRPLQFIGGVLVVETDNSAWSQQIAFVNERIVHELQAQDVHVSMLRIRVKASIAEGNRHADGSLPKNAEMDVKAPNAVERLIARWFESHGHCTDEECDWKVCWPQLRTYINEELGISE